MRLGYIAKVRFFPNSYKKMITGFYSNMVVSSKKMIKTGSKTMNPLTDIAIIVEGLSDKKKVMQVVREPVEVICTNGTIGFSKLDELVEELEGRDIFILVDSDASGDKLRKQLKREFPLARNLYIDHKFKEVATAPLEHLAQILLRARIDVHAQYLHKG